MDPSCHSIRVEVRRSKSAQDTGSAAYFRCSDTMIFLEQICRPCQAPLLAELLQEKDSSDGERAAQMP